MRDWNRNNVNDNDNNSDSKYDNDGDNDISDDESSATNDSDMVVVSESEIMYFLESFYAVVIPVTISMVVSALAVVYINTEETIEAGEKIYASVYLVFDVGGDESSDQSAIQKIGLSLVNTLVFIAVICAMTYVLVLCYKYNCTKIFYGYMVLVTAALLGYFTSHILLMAISIYPWIVIDKLTFAFLMYNYAAVGTVAIFLPRGFPSWVPQGYLIASSVCLAWQLSYFNSWMAWTLLVMLALYDIFAVLTPCGPLKALTELISGDGAAGLPGMLYEARLPRGIGRDQRRRRESAEPERANHRNEDREGENENLNVNVNVYSNRSREISNENDRPQKQVEQHGQQSTERQQNDEGDVPPNSREIAIPSPLPMSINSLDTSNKGKAPLVLAKMYKLPIMDNKGYLRLTEQQRNCRRTTGNYQHETDNNSVLQEAFYYTVGEMQEIEWTPRQLKTEVICIFPPRGGRIVRAKSREQRYDAGIAYIEYDRSGNQKHKFVVSPTGSVMEVVRREGSGEGNDDDDDEENNTIKLGLGDFIFYSVLVSKAAQYSFTAFASCLLVVLTGLAATLVILAIRSKALPALPISIFLGVITFLWTKTLVQPWVGDLLIQSIYV